MYRVNPSAVCRTLLAALEDKPELTPDEQDRVIIALKNSGVKDGIDRFIASAARVTLEALLSHQR